LSFEDGQGAKLKMGLQIFYPAPPELPVPIRPSRGGEKIWQLINKTDWRKLCNLRDDSLVRAGALWLYGFLDETHQLVQSDHTAEGSYWHALMHRSEGDYSNSMYWYDKVGRHAIFPLFRKVVEKMETSAGGQSAIKSLLEEPQWNPHGLVELCREASRGQFSHVGLLQRIAAAEYNLLMDFVLKQVAGS
jgi:hypothetical protein